MSENSSGLVIYFDAVHIISVNPRREEARLFENGGSGEGKLVFTSDEPAAKASFHDPFQLIQWGLQFSVCYELLAQVASPEARSVLETLGAQEFIQRVVALTSDQERRERLRGLGYRPSSYAKPPEPARQSEPKAAAPADAPPAQPETRKRAAK